MRCQRLRLQCGGAQRLYSEKLCGRKVEESALYLLDEPENSLSPERQLELVKFIEEAAKYLNCQFIISTHSPFLLGMKGAKIYDLDTVPVRPKKWTQLKNVQLFYQFFKERQEEFE